MIIHHYYPQHANVGDAFVRDGIRKLIRANSPAAEFVDFPVNKSRQTDAAFGVIGDNVLRNNREADIVVIGGSNLYQCRKSGRWGVHTTLEDIKKIRKPILLIGLGAGSSFGNRERPCPQAAAEQIRLLNSIAIASSVRDVLTARFLDSLGVNDYQITGCPATFVFDHPLTFSHSLLVAISFPPARFRKRRLVFHSLIRAIRKYIGHLHALGLTPVVTCHDQRDVHLARHILEGDAKIFWSDRTQDYYRFYSNCRIVVGFRLHASIISLSLGVPFIPVHFDYRGLGFAQTYGSTEWSIDGTRFGLFKSLVARTYPLLAGDLTPYKNFLARKATLYSVMTELVSKCLKML